MRLYVAGPMTGLPKFNYPAFNEAAKKLRTYGFSIANPAENTNPGGEWEDWLRQSIAQVLGSHGVAVLPDWQQSKGARLEVHVATELGMEVQPVDWWLSYPNPGNAQGPLTNGERQSVG